MRATPKKYLSKEGSLSKYIFEEGYLSRSKDTLFWGLSLSYLGFVHINIPKVTRHLHHWPHNLVSDTYMCVQLMLCQQVRRWLTSLLLRLLRVTASNSLFFSATSRPYAVSPILISLDFRALSFRLSSSFHLAYCGAGFSLSTISVSSQVANPNSTT